MSQVEQVVVGDVTYNIAQAPAMQQKKLMMLIGGKVALTRHSTGEDINVDVLVGTLVTLPEDTFDKVAAIVTAPIRLSGDNDTVVDVKMFQGRITEYFKLVAEAIKVNLNDFFIYLGTEEKPEKTEQAIT